MNTIHQLFIKDKQIHNFLEQIKNNGADGQLVTGLTGSARPALIHSIFQETEKSIYIISSNLLQAQKLVDDLSALVGEEFVHYYPAEEFIAANITTSNHCKRMRV